MIQNREVSGRSINAPFDFQVQIENSDLMLTIEDNGRGLGRKPESSGTEHDAGGHGLASMKERVEKLGGRFKLESSATGGTAILIQVPLNRVEGARR